jgi:hypothetical protein
LDKSITGLYEKIFEYMSPERGTVHLTQNSSKSVTVYGNGCHLLYVLMAAHAGADFSFQRLANLGNRLLKEVLRYPD